MNKNRRNGWRVLGLVTVVVLLFTTMCYLFTGVLPQTPLQVALAIHLLKPGMTEAEVDRYLGFNHLVHPAFECSGPGGGRCHASLPLGNQIGLVWNRSIKPARLTHAAFNGHDIF